MPAVSAGCRGRAWQRAAFPVHAFAARKEPGGDPQLLPGCRGAGLAVPGAVTAECHAWVQRRARAGPDRHPGPPRRGAASPTSTPLLSGL